MSTDSTALPVAILGGGITGLTAAWHLHQAQTPVRVFEAAPTAGGVIISTRQDGWLQESGPNSMLEGSAEVSALIDAVGLNPRRLYADDSAKNRYVMRDGKLVAMPTSPMSFVMTKLFSIRAKLALLGEPWRAKAPADLEESVGAFVKRRLGPEFLDYAINPFVGGVYAGDPCQLSVTHGFPKLHALEQEHGSLIRGALKRRNTSGGPKGRILSFPEGLAELPLALASALGDAVRFSQRVTTVRRVDQHWEITSEQDGTPVTEKFSSVVCALPAAALAAINFEELPGSEQLSELLEIEHPPVTSVFVGYRRDQVEHPLDGFGLLVPEVEQRRMLGVLFSSALFPNRAPDGHVALTVFIGGVRAPDLAGLDEAELRKLIAEELGELLGAKGEPAHFSVIRWPRAIPQYTLGYARFKNIFTSVEAAAPGLFFGGNARDGISLANCIESGRRLAEAVNATAK